MSAAREEVARIVTAETAAELLWERVFAGEYANVRDAARAMWPGLRFVDDDLEQLALRGLIDFAEEKQRLTHVGRATNTQRPAIGFGAPHGAKKWAKYFALTWPYAAADGTTKPLLDFTLDDWAASEEKWDNYASSYGARAAFAKKTQETLAAYSAPTLKALPANVLALVAEEAAVVMQWKQGKL